jgi:hypothetical protein
VASLVVLAIALTTVAALLVLSVALVRHLKLLSTSVRALGSQAEPLLEDIRAGSVAAQERLDRMARRAAQRYRGSPGRGASERPLG